MEEALEKGSWSVMGCCFNLKKWDVKQAVQDISFLKVSFWIHVHKLPLEMLTRTNAKRIGRVLGDLEKVEDPEWKSGVGRCFLRMKMAIDVEKPLVAGFWVPRENGKVWAEVKYEKMADFCFECGRLGHVMKNCKYGDEGIDRGSKEKVWDIDEGCIVKGEREGEYRSKSVKTKRRVEMRNGKEGGGVGGTKVEEEEKDGKKRKE